VATESIGKTVHLDNDMADRIISAQKRLDKNPPEQSSHQIRWGDPDEISRALRKEYGCAK